MIKKNFYIFILFLIGLGFLSKVVVNSRYVKNELESILKRKSSIPLEALKYSDIEFSVFPLGIELNNLKLGLEEKKYLINLNLGHLFVELNFFDSLFSERRNFFEIELEDGVVHLQIPEPKKGENKENKLTDIKKN